MININIKKEELQTQLFPFKYQQVIIFSTLSLKGKNEMWGLFGLKNNQLIFIPHENLPDELQISIPESPEENVELTQILEWTVSRITTTKKLAVEGHLYISSEVIFQELMDILVSTRSKNKVLERSLLKLDINV